MTTVTTLTTTVYRKRPLLPIANWLCVAIWLAVVGVGSPGRGEPPTKIRFRDATPQSGIDFQHIDGSSGRHYLVETVASGMASFDYDLDGRIDIHFLNGAAIKGIEYSVPPINGTFRNRGDMTFADVSRACGLDDIGFSMGVTVGDYDNDGFPDVYLSNFGPNALYHNNGDGTFSKLDQPVLTCGSKVGSGVAMLDIEGDGDLDIYAAHYIQFDYDMRPPSIFRGRIVYGGPVLYPPEADSLLRNNGDGTFEDISQESGIGLLAEWGMGVVCLDFDVDGDTDIFVANDSTKNFLWENDGRGHFTDVALATGVAYNHRGEAQGSMGADVGDFNGDLLPDIHVTAFTKQLTLLYENMASGFFQDSTLRTGAGAGTFYLVNWGNAFGDFDNDGDKDLFIANGHIHDNMDDLDDTVSYKLRNQVFENSSGRKFTDVSRLCGDGLAVKESSRGIAADDFDNDGHIDIAVLNSRTMPTILYNESIDQGNWVLIDLVGVQSNRSAAGSRVVITCGAKSQMLEVHCGRSYQSHFGSRLHFGIGSTPNIDRIDVHWHSGEVETHTDVEANALLKIRQGQSILRFEGS